MEQDLCQAVTLAAAHPGVRDAVLRLYQDVQTEIDRRRPRCAMSGRCCRFEEFGHRLYVTTVELTAFLHDFSPREQMTEQLRQAIAAWDGSACPFQVGKLCGAHAIRPFGCRIFFCDPEAKQWQEDLYERFHATLKRLHEQFDVPYFYVEWRQAVRICL